MRQFATVSCLAIWVCLPTALAAAESTAFSPKDQQSVEALALAYRLGEPAAFFEVAGPLLSRWSDGQLAEANRQLTAVKLPEVARMAAEARAFASLGADKSLPKMQQREALLVLPILTREIEKGLDEARGRRVMANPLPVGGDMTEFEQLLWETHVLSNQLKNLSAAAESLETLVKGVPKAGVEKHLGLAAILDVDYAEYGKQVNALAAELEERDIEVRIWRIGAAKDVLLQPELNAEKLRAAYAAPVDAEIIKRFFENRRGQRGAGFLRSDLNDPALPKDVAKEAQDAAELAGDLSVKARLLFDGLHWWMRGRYGRGPEVYGLAKPVDAVRNPKSMFALYMPESPPKPVDPFGYAAATSTPASLDRRHHYWWGWEERSVERFSLSSGYQAVASETNVDFSSKHFY